MPCPTRQDPSNHISGSGACTLPARHNHLQHSADPATSQHLQQLREVGKALWRGLHLSLQPEPGVMRPWPQDSRSPPQPGQVLTSGSPMAESNPAETRTSSGLNCRQGPVGRGRKEAGAEAEERPLQRDPPHPRGSVPLWAPHRPRPPATETASTPLTVTSKATGNSTCRKAAT